MHPSIKKEKNRFECRFLVNLFLEAVIRSNCGNDCSENPASPEANAEVGAELQRKACLPPKISRLLFVENY